MLWVVSGGYVGELQVRNYKMVVVAQPGRALACGASRCGFKSRQPPQVKLRNNKTLYYLYFFLNFAFMGL